MNIFQLLDENLEILQAQLPFAISDYKLGYRWEEQCRMQVWVQRATDGKEFSLETTLKLKIIHTFWQKELKGLLTYNPSKTPTHIYCRGQLSAYHLYSNWYADID